MEERRYYKNKEQGLSGWDLQVVDGLDIQMAQTPFMYRNIPLTPELINSGWVPPIFIETTISKTSDLRGEI